MRLFTGALEDNGAIKTFIEQADGAVDLEEVSKQMNDEQKRAFPESFSKWAASAREVADLAEFIDSNNELLPATVFEVRKYFSPIRPVNVFGVGMNYRSFIEQIGEDIPRAPALFHKTAASVIGHGESITLPDPSVQAVVEGELAVVIGLAAWRISPEQVGSHVAGYCCANDVSARNYEFETSQWTGGKMLPTFCPLGPNLVTGNEIRSLLDLTVKTYINEECVQEGNTSEMVFGVETLVSIISHRTRLEPGDVILTGTPSDLGALDPPKFLQPGDRTRVEIDGVGVLRNTVIRGW